MIERIDALTTLRERVGQWKSEGLRVALVPTMGSLHEGHLSLVRLAAGHADRVVASVFVNPTQFGPGEDFERYPRDPDGDSAMLASAGCDALWLPSVDTMYPFGVDNAVRMHVPGLSDVLEGAHRPGHFDGVVTVVSRLFNQVQPDVAVFGRKDYQQLAIIGYLVRELAFPVSILRAEIQREPDGLAMSSRNRYLSDADRERAPGIHLVLRRMREAVQAGQSAGEAELRAYEQLEGAGFSVDYAVIRTPDLSLPQPASGNSRVALIAARCATARLIDNIEFSIGE